MMNRHMFKVSWELLDLGVMEMDKVLFQFFCDLMQRNDLSKAAEFEFVNEDGVSRKIKVNLDERLLQGRGIKGLFVPYEQASHVLIEVIGVEADQRVRIGLPMLPDGSWHDAIEEKMVIKQRMDEVLTSMRNLRLQDDTWFDLYERAQQFTVKRVDELVCLPHIRDLQPFEYQTRTVKAVIWRLKGRAMLCDEVGLGKTVEAGLCMLEYIMRGLARKILVLVPPSLVNQWHEEMKRKFNQDFIRSDDPEFVKLGSHAWSHYNKVIASISTAKRSNHSKVISELQYDLVIVDEAHHLKNRSTVAWQFVNSLRKKYMLLLTATPVQNNLEELYNLITLLKPGQLKTYSHFRKNFVEDNQGIEVKNADKLKALLAEVMIRNRRSNVDVVFTKRFANTKTVQLSEPEQRLYADVSKFIREHYLSNHPVFSRFMLKSMQEQMGSTFSSLVGSLQRLAAHKDLTTDLKSLVQGFYERASEIAGNEAAQSAKIAELCKIVISFQNKMLIFTKFRATQELLVKALQNRGLKVAQFHGGLLRKEKEQEVAYFREAADVLVSTEVGGEGRNLQFCNGMVNFDLPWNPMAIEQRIGRIHRIGQGRDVFVYNLAAQHTLEHHILHVLDRKINMFELVIGEVDLILGDVEESEEFSDIVMNAWVRSDNDSMMELEMDKIGDQLLENKEKLQRVKELDDHLFA